MSLIACTSCHKAYPNHSLPYRCLECGGVFDYLEFPAFHLSEIETRRVDLWRYRAFFDLPHNARAVSLGEGRTPLLWQNVFGREVGFKLESLNPTGSYKDRGTAILVSQLVSQGVKSAVEDSSGNAGASFAAYAAQAGLIAKVYVPESASGPKRAQIERYGAQLISIPGSRQATAEAVLKEVSKGVTYASHAYLPFGLTGIATIAYELWEELGSAPGTVIAPAGHGGLMLGIVRGFSALIKSGLTKTIPYYVVSQAEGCSPIVSASLSRSTQLLEHEIKPTIAEGVSVRHPVRMNALLREIPKEQGVFVAIKEEEILTAFTHLAQRGIYIEPTSALVWAAYQKLIINLPQPVILIMTGSGLKYP